MITYYIRVNNVDYPAISIDGKLQDDMWDNRHTKKFRIPITYAEAKSVFVDGVSWAIVSVTEPDAGEEPFEPFEEVFSNDDFPLAGNITDHRDGTVSITMGKLTDLEEAYILLYGKE